jgi:hypothetical protein
VKIREAVAWLLVVMMAGGVGWQHYRSHLNWQEKERWKTAYFRIAESDRGYAEPNPVYVPERNDYVCPPSWTPAGAWGPNGVPLNPYRPIGCKREEQAK